MKESQIKLIRQLEDEFHGLMHVPSDDPRLIKLQHQLNHEVTIYHYKITNRYTGKSRYAKDRNEATALLNVSVNEFYQLLSYGSPFKHRDIVTRGEWNEREVGTWHKGRRSAKRRLD